jgi:hypothetical protein
LPVVVGSGSALVVGEDGPELALLDDNDAGFWARPLAACAYEKPLGLDVAATAIADCDRRAEDLEMNN